MRKGDELEDADRVSVRQGNNRGAYPIFEIPVDPRNKSCKAGKETRKRTSESSSGTWVKSRVERDVKLLG